MDAKSVRQAFERIERVVCDFGTAVLIVGQKVREVLKLASRVHILRNGVVSYTGRAEDLARDDSELRRVYF